MWNIESVIIRDGRMSQRPCISSCVYSQWIYSTFLAALKYM